MRRVDGKSGMTVGGGGGRRVVGKHRIGSKNALSKQENCERHLWLLQYICLTCCGTVMGTERVGEEVATRRTRRPPLTCVSCHLLNILLSHLVLCLRA